MVDSREINNADGSMHQRQRKQMEVFQSQIPGGSMQMVRTVTTSSSSSSRVSDFHFDDLKLPVNHLDLSSQKVKVSVGRSGSIGSRRPPSRPRSLAERARIFSDESQKSFFNSSFVFANGTHQDDPDSQVTIEEVIEDEPHQTLSKTKSNSTENLKEEDTITRGSKLRRSLQISKSNEEKSVDWDAENSNLPLRERAKRIESLLRDSQTWTQPKDKVTVTMIRNNSFREEKKNECDVDDGISVEGDKETYKRSNGTGSLESRTSKIQTNRSDEWYSRRKSYGFETVEKPEKTSILSEASQAESSTDSGICRSAENVPSWVKIVEQRNAINKEEKNFSNNWNSLKEVANAPTKTHFTNGLGDKCKFSSQNHDEENEKAWNRKSPLPIQKNSMKENLKTSLTSAKNPWISQLSGTRLAEKIWNSEDWGRELTTDDNDEEWKENGTKTDEEDLVLRKKKVEFSKTEVHFAAESGRLNIVETDGKPPSNNCFRRRRKVPSQKNNTDKDSSTIKTDKITEKIEAELQELSRLVIETIPVRDEKEHEESTFKNATILPKLPEGEEFLPQIEKYDEHKPRSILKNFRKSYLLGEMQEEFPKQEFVSTTTPIWKSTVVLKNNTFNKPSKQYSSDGEAEFQTCLKNLRRSDGRLEEENITEVKRRSIPDEILLKSSIKAEPVQIIIDERPLLSVAERVKQVEELKTKNYSTKIHFGPGETRVIRENDREDEGMNRIWIPPPKETEKPITTKEPLMKRAWIGQPPAPSTPLKSDSHETIKSFSTQQQFLKQATGKAPEAPKYDDVIRRSWNSGSNKSCRNEETIRRHEQARRSWSNSTEQVSNVKVGSPLTSRAYLRQRQPSDKPEAPSLFTQPNNSKNDHSSVFVNGSNLNHDPVVSRLRAPITIHNQQDEVIKPLKPVVEMVSRFNSLSKPPIKPTKNKDRRRTVPVNFKAKTKQYTQADLEEELKNFTENLDKDFKSIYEEEIESLRERSRLSVSKQNLAIDRCIEELGNTLNYNSEDSDLAADHEVRSYMSTGHDESDSEDERKVFKSWDRKAVFNQIKTVSLKTVPEKTSLPYTSITSLGVVPKAQPQPVPSQTKIASISLRYEDDPLFSKQHSSSNTSLDNNRRHRVSYLNCPSLSEKYSKLLRTTAIEPRQIHSDDAASEKLNARRYSDISLDRLSDITCNRKKYASTRADYVQDKSILDSRKKVSIIKAKLESSYSDLNGSMDTLNSSEDEKQISRRSGRCLDTISEATKLSQILTKKYDSSSMESIGVERSGRTAIKTKPVSRSSSKSERLNLRASSREACLQHSSSEDVSAGEIRRPRRVKEGKKVDRKPSIKEEKHEVIQSNERKSETKRTAKVHRTRSSEMKQRSNGEGSFSRRSSQKSSGDQPKSTKSSEKVKEYKNSSTRTSQLRESARHKSSSIEEKTKKTTFNRFTR